MVKRVVVLVLAVLLLGGQLVTGAEPAAALTLAQRRALLSEAHGAARDFSSLFSARECRVTNLADAGPNSLRDCATRPGAGWVTFAVGGTIQLASAVEVMSNKVIDGRGQRVTLRGKGLAIYEEARVIVTSLTFMGITGPADDAVQIAFDNDLVWVHRNTFFSTQDGTADITFNVNGARPQHRFTVSWNRFVRTTKTMLISADPMNDPGVLDDSTTVTLDHNYFDAPFDRTPRCVSTKCDLYNNYVRAWTGSGSESRGMAQTHAEKNIYDATVDVDAMLTAATTEQGDGYARNAGNLLRGGAKFFANRPELVFRPSYTRAVEPATQTLATKLMQTAGDR